MSLASDIAPEPSSSVLEGVWARLDPEAAGSSVQRLPRWLRQAVLLVAGQVPRR